MIYDIKTSQYVSLEKTSSLVSCLGYFIWPTFVWVRQNRTYFFRTYLPSTIAFPYFMAIKVLTTIKCRTSLKNDICRLFVFISFKKHLQQIIKPKKHHLFMVLNYKSFQLNLQTKYFIVCLFWQTRLKMFEIKQRNQK